LGLDQVARLGRQAQGALGQLQHPVQGLAEVESVIDRHAALEQGQAQLPPAALAALVQAQGLHRKLGGAQQLKVAALGHPEAGRGAGAQQQLMAREEVLAGQERLRRLAQGAEGGVARDADGIEAGMGRGQAAGQGQRGEREEG